MSNSHHVVSGNFRLVLPSLPFPLIVLILGTFRLSNVWLFWSWGKVSSLFFIFSDVAYFFDIKILISQGKLQEMGWGVKTNLAFMRTGMLFTGNIVFNKQRQFGNLWDWSCLHGALWELKSAYRFISLILRDTIHKHELSVHPAFLLSSWGNKA